MTRFASDPAVKRAFVWVMGYVSVLSIVYAFTHDQPADYGVSYHHGFLHMLTYPFVHSNPGHLLNNMIVGSIILALLAMMIPSYGVALITMIAWAGTASALYLIPPSGAPTVGSSGIILAWAGACFLYSVLLENKTEFDGMKILMLALFIGSTLFHTARSLSWVAHWSGTLIGMVVMFVCFRRDEFSSRPTSLSSSRRRPASKP